MVVFLLSLNTHSIMMVLLYIYLTIYSLTVIGIFWSMLSTLGKLLKTLYSFSMLSFNSFFMFTLTVFLFSLAGVPPFLGFFVKLFLFNIMAVFGFFLFYFIFFIMLILGLYFYMQNLRFLHSTNHKDVLNPYLNSNERVVMSLYYYLMFQVVVLINGVYTVEDFLTFFYWLLN